MISNMEEYDVIIAGGGAAGLAAAVFAARRGFRVAVIEPNNILGKKLRITGKGRCNVTNDCDVREFLENVHTCGKFLTSAVNAFPPSSAISFFTELGVPLKTERGRRVFPVSDNANNVADALEREVRRLGAEIIRAKVTNISALDGAVSHVTVGNKKLPCRAAVIATGGLSYPATGSTGDGYALSRSLGHTVTELRPSLVPLVSPNKFCAEMQGLSLKNVRFTVHGNKNKPLFEDFGELMFTHYGLSGPLALSASAYMDDFNKNEYTVSINLKPALDDVQLDERIQRDFREYSNNDFKNSLTGLLPRLMIPVFVKLSGIDPDKKTHSVTRAERRQVLELLRRFKVHITGTRPLDEAVVTAGGVDTREIVPATMESKIVRNLHFAGEVINADAYTGGYNLHIAWATAYCAGTRLLTKK